MGTPSASAPPSAAALSAWQLLLVTTLKAASLRPAPALKPAQVEGAMGGAADVQLPGVLFDELCNLARRLLIAAEQHMAAIGKHQQSGFRQLLGDRL